jgi:hypothetical protein
LLGIIPVIEVSEPLLNQGVSPETFPVLLTSLVALAIVAFVIFPAMDVAFGIAYVKTWAPVRKSNAATMLNAIKVLVFSMLMVLFYNI